MRYAWRWFGPNDPVSITDVMQVGAKEVVTALHHLPNGTVWGRKEIRKRQHEAEWNPATGKPTGLKWTIVESVPVHEDIKKQRGNFRQYIENYKQTLVNLGECGIKIVIYNFMPVIDWTRTSLGRVLPNGAKALSFNEDEFAAFDLFILKREQAEADYTKAEVERAEKTFSAMDAENRESLTRTIIAGLPGAEESFTPGQFKAALDEYKNIDSEKLRSHLIYFLREIMPAAENAGVKLAIHSDDPPRPLFGLPRIMSNMQDMEILLNEVKSTSCGLNICAGSLGVNADNDIPAMIRRFGNRVYFVHLRSVKRAGKSFFEDEHIAGSVNLAAVIKAVLEIEKSTGTEIPIRPDHGHQMLDDLRKKTNPGYSCIGRMKGLAEIKGMELALRAII
ncbi:MAG: mannonate dehydratase [Victivallales bacterium]|nr:mannonate dehydratase [Victivallales bacterium]